MHSPRVWKEIVVTVVDVLLCLSIKRLIMVPHQFSVSGPDADLAESRFLRVRVTWTQHVLKGGEVPIRTKLCNNFISAKEKNIDRSVAAAHDVSHQPIADGGTVVNICPKCEITLSLSCAAKAEQHNAIEQIVKRFHKCWRGGQAVLSWRTKIFHDCEKDDTDDDARTSRNPPTAHCATVSCQADRASYEQAQQDCANGAPQSEHSGEGAIRVISENNWNAHPTKAMGSRLRRSGWQGDP